MKRLLLLCVMWYGNIVFSSAKNSSKALVVQEPVFVDVDEPVFLAVDPRVTENNRPILRERLTVQHPRALVEYVAQRAKMCDQAIEDLATLKKRHHGLALDSVEYRARTQEQVASLETDQKALREKVDFLLVNFVSFKKIEELKAAQKELKDEVASFEAKFAPLTKVAALETAQATLQGKVASFEAKFAPSNRVDALEAAQATLQGDMEYFEENFTRITDLETAQEQLNAESETRIASLERDLKSQKEEVQKKFASLKKNLKFQKEEVQKKVAVLEASHRTVVGCSVAVCSAMALFAFSPKTIPELWKTLLTRK